MTAWRSQPRMDFFGTQHQVLDVLGEGTFSVVMKCCNLFTKKMEAVKMFKYPHDDEVALREVSILQKLRRLDPDKSNIIRWNCSFSSERLTWISFELLDRDLRMYMRSKRRLTKTMGLRVGEIRPILHQLTTALHHLKTIGIVHADLKPDNILCVNCNQQPIRVKLADFGLAQFSDNINSALPAQSLCYRAPEVLVGASFDEAIDMWSLGATAAELVLGTFLYGVSNKYDALRAIIETQGQPPDDVLDQGKYTYYYFEKSTGHLPCWRIKNPAVFQQQTGHCVNKELEVLGCLADILAIMVETHGPQQGQYLLIDLITEMLSLDPKDRIDPVGALNHKFFSEEISTSRNSQQEDIQEPQTSDFRHEHKRDVQLENNGHSDKHVPKSIQSEDDGPVLRHVVGCHPMVNCEYAQEEIPANGQYGSWIPEYSHGNHQYLPLFAPMHFAYVHPGIPAWNQMANYIYVPGNSGFYQPRICPKPSGVEEAKRLYKHVLI